MSVIQFPYDRIARRTSKPEHSEVVRLKCKFVARTLSASDLFDMIPEVVESIRERSYDDMLAMIEQRS